MSSERDVRCCRKVKNPYPVLDLQSQRVARQARAS